MKAAVGLLYQLRTLPGTQLACAPSTHLSTSHISKLRSPYRSLSHWDSREHTGPTHCICPSPSSKALGASQADSAGKRGAAGRKPAERMAKRRLFVTTPLRLDLKSL